MRRVSLIEIFVCLAKAVNLGDIKSLQAEQGDAASYYSCKATLVLMKSENAMYNSCPGENCNKKVSLRS